jgi:hypothetical protein
MSHQFAKFVTGHFNQLTEAIGSPIKRADPIVLTEGDFNP